MPEITIIINNCQMKAPQAWADAFVNTHLALLNGNTTWLEYARTFQVNSDYLAFLECLKAVGTPL